MRRKKWLIATLLIVIIIGGIGYFTFSDVLGHNLNQIMSPNDIEFSDFAGSDSEVLLGSSSFGQPIRPAAEVVAIRATGNIKLQEQETLVSNTDAIINKVHVKVGDTVAAGDILVELDTKKLEREVEEARFNLAKARTELKKLIKPPEPDKVTAAEQKLLIAREELQTVQAGPTTVELQAAEAEAFVAWAKYNELAAGKTDDELAKERNALRQAERKLQRAQEAYDEVSWRSDFEPAETAARALEEATDAYESAKASYNEATKPTKEKDLKEQNSAALQAQEKLEKLRQKPTKKEITEAELKVVEAQAELNKLTDDPDPDKIAEIKMDIDYKKLLLTDAEARLTSGKVTAPFAGTVVAVDAQAGKTAEVNKKMVTIANLQVFNLTVNVPEAKINRLYLGQPVTISLDALPDDTFSGKVSYISPISKDSEEASVVSYAVTVQLEITGVEGIRSGMTAVVSFVDEKMESAWLVPTTSIQQGDGEATITVYRDDESLTVNVEPDLKRGEWTVVHAPDLQAGDKVEAEFNSFLNDGAMFGVEDGVAFDGEAEYYVE